MRDTAVRHSYATGGTRAAHQRRLRVRRSAGTSDPVPCSRDGTGSALGRGEGASGRTGLQPADASSDGDDCRAGRLSAGFLGPERRGACGEDVHHSCRRSDLPLAADGLERMERLAGADDGRNHPRDGTRFRREGVGRSWLVLCEPRRWLAAGGEAECRVEHREAWTPGSRTSPQRPHRAEFGFPEHEGAGGLSPFLWTQVRHLFLSWTFDVRALRRQLWTRGDRCGDLGRMGRRLREVRLVQLPGGVPSGDGGAQAGGGGLHQTVPRAVRRTAEAAARLRLFLQRRPRRRAVGRGERVEHLADMGRSEG